MIKDNKTKIAENKENTLNSADISKDSYYQNKVYSLKRHYEDEEILKRTKKIDKKKRE